MTTLITWPHGSAHGEREGTRLHQVFSETTTCVGVDALDGLNHQYFNMVILIGYDEEIAKNGTMDAVVTYAKHSDIQRVVLASLGSGASGNAADEGASLATLAEGFAKDAPGYALVAARPFSCEEVGNGSLFVAGDFDIRPAHHDDTRLWREYRRPDAYGDTSGFA
ncbi:MAG: hypothetical protein WBW32_00035 [Luteibacter sp.]